MESKALALDERIALSTTDYGPINGLRMESKALALDERMAPSTTDYADKRITHGVQSFSFGRQNCAEYNETKYTQHQLALKVRFLLATEMTVMV